MSKKGFMETLLYLEVSSPQYYNDIKAYLERTKTISSRASIAAVLNTLYDMGLVDRQEITSVRPIRTKYSLSKKGKAVLSYLRQIEVEIN